MKKFGSIQIRNWEPNNPGFNLGIKELFYYSIIRRIKTIPILYYSDYIRSDVDEILAVKLKWQNPGAHYFDDLYQSLMTVVMKKKFNIDRRIYNYSALVRSGQMERSDALKKVNSQNTIEDPQIIKLCLKRLGVSEDEFKTYIDSPPKTFLNYKNNYNTVKRLKYFVFIMCKLNLLPSSTFYKYFKFGI